MRGGGGCKGRKTRGEIGHPWPAKNNSTYLKDYKEYQKCLVAFVRFYLKKYIKSNKSTGNGRRAKAALEIQRGRARGALALVCPTRGTGSFPSKQTQSSSPQLLLSARGEPTHEMVGSSCCHWLYGKRVAEEEVGGRRGSGRRPTYIKTCLLIWGGYLCSSSSRPSCRLVPCLRGATS